MRINFKIVSRNQLFDLFQLLVKKLLSLNVKLKTTFVTVNKEKIVMLKKII